MKKGENRLLGSGQFEGKEGRRRVAKGLQSRGDELAALLK
jgi:hypothetical protein